MVRECKGKLDFGENKESTQSLSSKHRDVEKRWSSFGQGVAGFTRGVGGVAAVSLGKAEKGRVAKTTIISKETLLFGTGLCSILVSDAAH